jgi:hypothetical protein
MCRHASASGTRDTHQGRVFRRFSCLPTASRLPIAGSGDIGTSPFWGSSLDKSVLATLSKMVMREIKHKVRQGINSWSGMASTYTRHVSPPGGGSFVGLRSARFNSELHCRVSAATSAYHRFVVVQHPWISRASTNRATDFGNPVGPVEAKVAIVIRQCHRMGCPDEC